MNTSMQNLKPCPFCGHVGVNVHEGSTFRWVLAECDNCGAQSPEARRDTTKAWPNEAEDTPKAIAEWNTRTAIEASQPEGDAKDAQRYRWLLDCGTTNFWIECGRMDSYDDVEAAVDAAIASQKGAA